MVLEQLRRGEEGIGICCRLGHAVGSTLTHSAGGPGLSEAALREVLSLEGVV